MWTMFANIYIYFPLIFSNYVTRHVVEYDKLRFREENICNAVWRMFANIYLFSPISFSNGVTRHVVEYDKLRFRPEFICNAVWRMFPNIYLFLPLNLSNGVCEECLQISIYIYPLFSQIVPHDILLSMINSDFGLKSFVILYVKNDCKYLFIFTPWFSQMVLHDMLLSVINSAFSQKSFVMLCEECFQISIYFYPKSLKWCQTRCCWVRWLQISARNHL